MLKISSQCRILQAFGGLSASFAVLCSAWLSHAGKSLPANVQNSLELALLFAFIHSLAIFIVVILVNQSQRKTVLLSGYFFAFGILAFSGLLILKAFIVIGELSKLTPFGGSAFAIGWLLLAFAPNKLGNKNL